MHINYKKELETASRGMIMIHDPKLLIKLIVRMIVRKLGIKHAGMLLYEPQKDSFVLSISRGESGERIPQGYARFNAQSPMIRLFTDQKFKNFRAKRNAILFDDIHRMIRGEGVLESGTNGTIEFLHKVDDQMQMYNTVACVPAYYRDNLMALLLLGEKHDGSRYTEEELGFFAALASDAAMAIRNAQLFNGLEREAKRNKELFVQTIIVLGSTIEAKDAYTHGHTERVTNYAMMIARQMVTNGSAKFGKKFFENLYIGGLMHDIGKIAVPESILNKKGKLTNEEFAIMQNHTVKGVEMVRALSLPQDCVDVIKYHHERYDGYGYPDGLIGEAIPVGAAILAVADTFDAMTSDRPYRKGLPKETALNEIKDNAGKQFNPLPVQAILQLEKQGKI